MQSSAALSLEGFQQEQREDRQISMIFLFMMRQRA
jgi:hypothetical protein